MQDELETLIKTRMERFDILLARANFNKNWWQKSGVEWCLRNELTQNPPFNCRGGIIADEMGLGKTIQAIGLMFTNFLKRTLIVVPPVLIEQWTSEIYKATGHNVLMYYKNLNHISNEVLANSPIVLTTYKTITSQSSNLNDLEWSRIIYDEAHHLRNSKTERYKACKTLIARVRWLITGTPVQNGRQDFYNLCSIAGLKSAFYEAKTPETKQILHDNFVLRRTKLDVGIKLPKLFEENIQINWKNDNEKALAEEIHALIPNQSGVSKDKRKKLAETFGNGGILTGLLRAKQSCILPRLMQKNIEMFESLGFDSTQYMEALQFSSKIDTVIDFIEARKNNGKGKIIFCHYTYEIDEVAKRLRDIGLKNVKTYDGRNSGPATLRALAEPSDALILQIQTGCEGLNLQENYSEIYFVAPHWNPSIEDQAIARCHRMGQKNPVDVFKFGMDGFTKQDISFEIYVTKRQKDKRQISEEILQK
jgi:SNF2 family DNA or RNA helicase